VIPGVVIVAAVLWAMTLLGTQTHWGYLLAGHIVMSIGFALLFTPLFTASLSSVPPQMYSYGSAVLGSLQQVAGAAGVAMFIAIMTAEQVRLAADGAVATEALAGGIRAAFFAGAIGVVFAVAAALFVRKPASAPAAH
jgi:DHA2 family lincomycin resistance protein-like MFS transporter